MSEFAAKPGRWFLLRCGYYLLLALWLIPVFYFSFNFVCFGTLHPLRVAELREVAIRDCAAAAASLVQYHQTYGQFPIDQKHFPAVDSHTLWMDASDEKGELRFELRDRHYANQSIRYRLSGTTAGWWTQGYFLNESIPGMPDISVPSTTPALPSIGEDH